MGLNEGEANWNAAAVGTNGGATLTIAAPAAGNKLVIQNIQVSGDAAAVVTVESPANTVLLKYRRAAAFADIHSFTDGVLRGADGAAMVVKVSASTSNSEANAQGWILPS